MRKQPLDFRREEVQYVMQRWRAAESCSLVGVGSVGKSNLLHHLADAEVLAHYLGKNLPCPVVIDPNMLGSLSGGSAEDAQFRSWAGYELMMHRLFLTFYPFDLLEEDAEQFYEAYQALQDGTNPLYAYMGLRYFELGLEFFLRRGIQIVFMFDEFEEMLRQMPLKFFLTLRGLRDRYKSGLLYLTFTRSPLPVAASRLGISEQELEPFIELFTDNVHYVGPYHERDARAMLEKLIERNNKSPYPAELGDFLLYASGRYAGLLRASFRVVESVVSSGKLAEPYDDELLQQLAAKRSVRAECRTIWTSLTPAEHSVLKTVARLSTYTSASHTEEAVAMLVQKRLLYLDKERKSLRIEPPLFRAFVGGNPDDLE